MMSPISMLTTMPWELPTQILIDKKIQWNIESIVITIKHLQIN